MNELVSRRTRSAVRDLVNVVTLDRIHTMWQDAGYTQPTTFPDGAGGEWVALFQAYLDQVDWSSPDQFARVRVVFEEAIEQRIRREAGTNAPTAYGSCSGTTVTPSRTTA